MTRLLCQNRVSFGSCACKCIDRFANVLINVTPNMAIFPKSSLSNPCNYGKMQFLSIGHSF